MIATLPEKLLTIVPYGGILVPHQYGFMPDFDLLDRSIISRSIASKTKSALEELPSAAWSFYAEGFDVALVGQGDITGATIGTTKGNVGALLASQFNFK
jgi:hypothetical protein